MVENTDAKHPYNRTHEKIILLRKRLGLDPVWKYEGGDRGIFALDGETYLDLLAETLYDPPLNQTAKI